jgi:predicted GH43/DUF377 family glycosyl hydrolase
MGYWFYVTYACRPFPFGQFWQPEIRKRFVTPDEFPRHVRTNATPTGLAMTKNFKTWQRAGWIIDPVLDDRDAILFPEKINGKFVLMHRPLEFVGPGYGVEKARAWIKESEDLLGLAAAPSKLLLKQRYPWEVNKLGMNTPAIKTAHGWFTIFRVVGADLHYRLGAVLLDLNDPSQVLHRTPDWLMQPEVDYEIEGYYRGCCFPCGTVVIDGTLLAYFGGADRYCAVATCDFQELLDHLLTCPP